MNSSRTIRTTFMDIFQKNVKRLEPFSLISGSQSNISSQTVMFAEVFIFLLVLIIYLRNKNKIRKKHGEASLFTDFNEEDKSRKIPMVSYGPIKVPRFVTGLITMFKMQRGGMQYWDDLAAKWGSLFELPIGGGTLIVADSQLAQKVLTSNDPQHLNKPQHIYGKIFLSGFQDGLINSQYELWTTHRKILNHCFTYKSLQSYLPFMNVHAKSLMSKFISMSHADMEDSVSGKMMYELIWSETIKIIIQTVMGDNCCSDEDALRIHENFAIGKSTVQYKFLHPILMFEPLWRLHPRKWTLDKAIDTLHSIAVKHMNRFKKTIKREQQTTKTQDIGGTGNKSNMSGEDDYVHLSPEENDVVGIKKYRCIIEEMLYYGASDKEIFDEIATIISTGHETTSLAVIQTMFHLASNPEFQTLCREEIDGIIGQPSTDEKLDDYVLTMDDLNNLKYLERCILESLRLTTTTPAFLRQLEAPLKVDEQLTLKEGSTVAIFPWLIHRDPKNYPTPLKYDPDRFLPENVRQRSFYQFIPFSGGSRNCIGYKFAIIEIKTILTWMLRYFEITTTDRPEEMKYRLELTLAHERDINMTLKRRKF